MGCKIEWDNPQQTIMRRTLSAPWSFADVNANEKDVYSAIHQNGKFIGMIVHITEPFYLPTDALRQFQNQLGRKPDEVVITVFVVKETPMVNILFGIVERMGRRSHHVVMRTEHIEDARELIYRELARYNDTAQSN